MSRQEALDTARTRSTGHQANAPDQQTYPLTSLQEDLLPLMREYATAARAYNIESVYVIRGPLDVRSFSEAVDAVIERHHALRTVFIETPDGARQKVLPPVRGALVVRDLSDIAPEAKAVALDNAVTADCTRLFSFTEEPPIRLSLYRTGSEEHVFVVVVHHLVFDGWSMGVLLRDLSNAYSLLRGRPVSPVVVACQLTDFASRQRDWLASPEASRMTDYWVRSLRYCPEGTTVPYDRVAPEALSFAGDRYTFDLPGSLARHVMDLARREKVTPTAVALLGFQLLLRELSGQEDIVVGLPLANRIWPGTQNCIGFLINTHALRQYLPLNAPLRDLLHTTAGRLAGAVQNQAIPLRNIYTALRSRYGEESLPTFLYQVMFICHSHPHAALQLGETTVERQRFDQRASKTDMTLNLWVRDESITGQLEYNTDLYASRTAHRVVQRYKEILADLAEELVW
ncbi:condensation domain-containing protein [Streptomyces sp. 5-10]|uniref:condensation domain-containing protein n=1 Tax=Streptomyces sp. 5-10 TaxID=878925 RepID=UPI00168BC34C|nr:condensation domain-containing protein [Streptomyces sp. 5-10]MBD3003827.1 hypothetical protein [Streptomyces sp. 5-10]